MGQWIKGRRARYLPSSPRFLISLPLPSPFLSYLSPRTIMRSSSLLATALAITGVVVAAPSPADVVAELKAAPAQVDRVNKILVQDSDVSFSRIL